MSHIHHVFDRSTLKYRSRPYLTLGEEMLLKGTPSIISAQWMQDSTPQDVWVLTYSDGSYRTFSQPGGVIIEPALPLTP